jgi:gamma-glutamyltranspeptidase/glutathione hydrolase
MRANLIFVVVALFHPVVLDAQRPSTMSRRSTVYAPNGAIATSQPLATAAGLAVLQRGGNAIDAAVTAAAVLSVTEPHMTGMGGDLFAIVWSAKDRKLYGLNATGRSGSLMTREEFVKRGRQRIEGVEAITVPGALSGWDALLQRFGTLRLGAALTRSCHSVCRQGLPGNAGHRQRLGRDRGSVETGSWRHCHVPAGWAARPESGRVVPQS